MHKNDSEQFLHSMSEIEIAFFVWYKLPDYLPATRKKVKEELDNMGLDMEKIRSIVTEHQFPEERKENICDRCGSSKLIEFRSDQETGKRKRAEKELPERTDENHGQKGRPTQCLICGYGSGVRIGKSRRLLKWWQKNKN